MLPDFSEEVKLWRGGFKSIVGADEVGRGAFAGPVVAAAVIFSVDSKIEIKINDSKKLTSAQRKKADDWIKKNCLTFGIGECPASKINKIGIVKATKIAFRRAIKNLKVKPDFLLIDAFYLPFTKGLKRKNQKAIIRGDSKSVSIAAASIIAKVYRDKLMKVLSTKHHVYSWENNAGYGTKKHIDAIKKHGITRYHRKQFVKNSVPEIY